MVSEKKKIEKKRAFRFILRFLVQLPLSDLEASPDQDPGRLGRCAKEGLDQAAMLTPF